MFKSLGSMQARYHLFGSNIGSKLRYKESKEVLFWRRNNFDNGVFFKLIAPSPLVWKSLHLSAQQTVEAKTFFDGWNPIRYEVGDDVHKSQRLSSKESLHFQLFF